MKYPYSTAYEPSFPVAPVVLRNSEEGLRTGQAQALLDTGSDGSLVPIAYLEEILAPPMTDTRIRSHWGEWRAAQLFTVDLDNVLSKLRLLLDGPAEQSDIKS